MLHPYRLGWLLPSTEIPAGKMMPWLQSERCTLPRAADTSTGPEPWGGHQQPLPSSCTPWCPWGFSQVLAESSAQGCPSCDTTDSGASSPSPCWVPQMGSRLRALQMWPHQTKKMSFSKVFTVWSVGKLRLWLGLHWKILVHYQEPKTK